MAAKLQSRSDLKRKIEALQHYTSSEFVRNDDYDAWEAACKKLNELRRQYRQGTT